MLYIDIENFSYENDDKIIFENASLKVSFDKMILSGKNGVGKSTFLKLIHKNLIKIYKEDLKEATILHISQNNMFFEELTAIENAKILNVDLDLFHNLILQFNDKIPLDSRLKKLSGGQKQLINLVIGLSLKRDLYLIDEPFNNLDKKTKRKILDYFNKVNMPIILVSHENVDLEGFTEVLIYKRGFVQNVS